MKVYVYPADTYGCGHYRLIWPGELLRAAGYDVEIVGPESRRVNIVVRDEHAVDMRVPDDADVLVLQRVTHQWVAEVVPIVRAKGVAVVVDVDDDLGAIHPSNPAWPTLFPAHLGQMLTTGKKHMHSWHHLTDACLNATLVTVSTPALLRRYATHGRGMVLPNCVPDHYLEIEHEDSDVVGWPGSIQSHPNDPDVLGPTIPRLIADGVRFQTVGDPTGAGRAFGLSSDPPGTGNLELDEWPTAIARLGVGIAPLADTRFNAAKSWLKPLEMSAVGVPWIGSPRAEYRRLHELGCGLLADKPKQWYGMLRKLTRDPAWRGDLSACGREVARTFALSRNAWRWAEAWEYAIELCRGVSPHATHA